MKIPKEEIKKYPLRLPKTLFKELENKSVKTMYSINLLIVEAIRNSLKNQ